MQSKIAPALCHVTLSLAVCTSISSFAGEPAKGAQPKSGPTTVVSPSQISQRPTRNGPIEKATPPEVVAFFRQLEAARKAGVMCSPVPIISSSGAHYILPSSAAKIVDATSDLKDALQQLINNPATPDEAFFSPVLLRLFENRQTTTITPCSSADSMESMVLMFHVKLTQKPKS
jgi:hypothetical protein